MRSLTRARSPLVSMAMVHPPSSDVVHKTHGPPRRASTVAVVCAVGLMMLFGTRASLDAQTTDVHYRYRADMPPGAIGRLQLQRGGPLRGYFQPVQIQGPPGVTISVVQAGKFQPPQPGPVTAGMLIGHVYRFRVTQIPLRIGQELFPTIEVIDRLYPPPGQETRFPIPVHLSQDELELALAGRFVTRVIYLENPQDALPHAEDPEIQRYLEVAANEDPLKAADKLGRPVAILRIGSRIPRMSGPSGGFLFGAPPLKLYPAATPPPNHLAEEGQEETGEAPEAAEEKPPTRKTEPNEP